MCLLAYTLRYFSLRFPWRRFDDGRYFNHTNGVKHGQAPQNVGTGYVLNKVRGNNDVTSFVDLNSCWALVDIPAGTVACFFAMPCCTCHNHACGALLPAELAW